MLGAQRAFNGRIRARLMRQATFVCQLAYLIEQFRLVTGCIDWSGVPLEGDRGLLNEQALSHACWVGANLIAVAELRHGLLLAVSASDLTDIKNVGTHSAQIPDSAVAETRHRTLRAAGSENGHFSRGLRNECN